MGCKQLTVAELQERINFLVSIGFGNARVYLLTDEEGNDVRPLYEGMEPGTVGADLADEYGIKVGSVVIG